MGDAKRRDGPFLLRSSRESTRTRKRIPEKRQRIAGGFMSFDKNMARPKHHLKGFAVPAINEMANRTERKEPRMNIAPIYRVIL